MSQTYGIGCKDCRKYLWIGQGWGKMDTLYSGDPKTMSALKDFLNAHASHHLIFEDMHNGPTEIGMWEHHDQ